MKEDWQPIDSAPRNDVRVLLLRHHTIRGPKKRRVIVIGVWRKGRRGNTYWHLENASNYGAAQDDDLAGWMPLPSGKEHPNAS